jgi:hypothetical protein
VKSNHSLLLQFGIVTVGLWLCPGWAGAFQILSMERNSGELEVEYESDTNSYFIASFSESLSALTTSAGMEMGRTFTGALSDAGLHNAFPAGFMAIRQVSVLAPMDSDQDGIDDVYEL